jgi:hypothetical protein
MTDKVTKWLRGKQARFTQFSVRNLRIGVETFKLYDYPGNLQLPG